MKKEITFNREITKGMSKWLNEKHIERLLKSVSHYVSIQQNLESQPAWIDQREQLRDIAKYSSALSKRLQNPGSSARAEITTVLKSSGFEQSELRSLPGKLEKLATELRKRIADRKLQNRRKSHAQLVAMIDSVTREVGMVPSRSDPSPFYEICCTVFSSAGLASPNRSISEFLNDRSIKI
jgi:hypothetical protein